LDDYGSTGSYVHVGEILVDTGPAVIEGRETKRRFDIRDRELIEELKLTEVYGDSEGVRTQGYCFSGFSIRAYPCERLVRDMLRGGKLERHIRRGDFLKYRV